MIAPRHTFPLALLLSLPLSQALLAQSNWVGTTSDLADPNNWNPAVLPSTAASTQLLFDGSSAQNILTFNGGTFSGSPGLGSITIAATQTAPLTITNAGAANSVFRVANSTNLTIQPNAGSVTLGGGGNSFFYNLGSGGVGNQFTNNSANLATFGANVSINASGGSGALVIFDGSGNWLISGPITNAATRGVIKNGTGTLTLNGNNAYAGPTVINAGTVILGSNTSLGTTAQGTTIATGATLNINGRNIQGEAISTAGTITNTGAQQLNALRTVTLSGNATFTGTGRFDVRGPTNTKGGLLDLAGHTLTKSGSNLAFIVDSNITPGTINVTGGTLGLSRSNWASGTVNLSSGTLRFDNNAAGNHSFGMDINFSGGTLNSQHAAPGQPVTFDGNLVLSGTGSRNIDTSNLTQLTLSGIISGSTGYTKNGSGTLRLLSANTLTGTSNLVGGVVEVGHDQAFGTGLLDLRGSTIRSTDATARTIANNVSLSNNTTFGSATSGDLTFNGNINKGGGAKIVNVQNTTTTFSGTIFGSGTTGALTKTGPGTLIQSGTSTFASDTVVQQGTLELTGIIQNSPVIVLPNGRFSGTGTVNSSLSIQGGTLAPGSQSLFGLGTLTLNGNLTFASTWEVSIDGPDASLLQHNGTFLGSLDDITLAAGTTHNPDLFTPYLIYSGTAPTTGTFANMLPASAYSALPSPFIPDGWITLDGTPYGIFYNVDLASLSPNGFDIVLVAIPEPSRPLLLAAALTPLLIRRRRH